MRAAGRKPWTVSVNVTAHHHGPTPVSAIQQPRDQPNQAKLKHEIDRQRDRFTLLTTTTKLATFVG